MQSGFLKHSVLLAGSALLLISMTSGAHAQQRQQGQQNTFMVPADQAAAVSQANRTISQLYGKIRRAKSVSDEDLTTLVTLAGDSKQHTMIRGRALQPLVWLQSDKLTGTQLAKIDQLVFAILQEDDKAADPEGFIKMSATSVASRVVRGKRFLDVLQPLTNDSREWVRTSAQQAYDSIKRDF